MAKDPAFLFYSKDFYEGVSTMSFEDRGKYITILCVMHQQGRLDEETICFLVGSVSVKLKSKFAIDENGMWFNERLESESEKRNKFIESRRNNGKMGGRRKASGKANGLASDNLKVKHMVNLPVNANVNAIIVDKESAWKELSNDPMLMEDAKITATQKGWRAPKEIDILGCMYTFVAKIELPTERDDLRRYWRNWLFREQTDKLIEYGKNYRQQRQQA